MIHTSKSISIYASDTSGVCSALYELSGLVVVHDASGCNSTYSTHDEPRWYDKPSNIFISGLTEIDAVLGNDDKLISDIVNAAKKLDPKFIAVCGSPMPMMTGTDFDAIAEKTEELSGIPTIALHTNGINTYLEGASEAFAAVLSRFCKEPTLSRNKRRVNILGETPLDLSNGTVSGSVKRWLCQNGFELCSALAMNTTLENVACASNADVSLVVSHCGLESARYLEKRFGIPYVQGLPVGTHFPKLLAESLSKAICTGESSVRCFDRQRKSGAEISVVGESVFAVSLANELQLSLGVGARALCPLEFNKAMLSEKDVGIPEELDAEREFSNSDIVIADPLYRPICKKNARFYSFAHQAFSGRCFAGSIPDIINKELEIKR